MARKKKEKPVTFSAVVYGVFDSTENKLVKVSLDKDEVDMDLALQYNENKYSRCEFELDLTL